jgi:alpha-L-fucosidase 2
LDNALLKIQYKTEGNEYEREYFYSRPHNALFIRLKSKEKKGLSFSVGFSSFLNHSVKATDKSLEFSGKAPIRADPSYVNNPKDPIVYADNGGTRFFGKLILLKSSGQIQYNDSLLSVKNATEVVLAVNLGTSFNGFDKNPYLEGKDEVKLVNEHIGKLKSQNWDAIKRAHLSDYKKYYDRVKLNLENGQEGKLATDERLQKYAEGAKDPYLEMLYFQFGRYLLISSSRTPGVPANLQGLWNPYLRPPWSSNYTMNINAQENYWAAESTNLSEMHAPFLGFIKNLSVTGAKTAKEFYNANGWVCNHNSDIWAMTNPVGNYGGGDPVWANWAMGGTWASVHLWDHYLFNQNIDFLRNDAYPLMKGAAEFCLEMLVKDKEGKYITSPGTSPENVYISPTGYKGATLYGATADIAMIKELFEALINASLILNFDQAFSDKLKDVLVHLSPYKIGKKGNLQEWYYDWEDAEPQHRHQTHLYGLYPGTHISVINTPELAEAAKKSLEIKGDETTGWSKGWRINLWARLWDGNRAYKMYRELLKYVEPDAIRPKGKNGGGTYPNLFDAHPPFQIDGNFGGTAAVAEMLVQSSYSTIYLLPALPDAWKNGSISGLKTRGGFEIAIEWAEGHIKKFTIGSERGGKTVLKYKDLEIPVTLKAGEKREIIKFVR